MRMQRDHTVDLGLRVRGVVFMAHANIAYQQHI